jgi:hypothetical protein
MSQRRITCPNCKHLFSIENERKTKTTRQLFPEQAAIIKGMLLRGDRQSDIAALFGVNPGRIAEIATGQLFAEVTAQRKGLPVSGPYHVRDYLQALEHAIACRGESEVLALLQKMGGEES